ncbi:hypothetical protein QQP08_007944 [Theobroma cacao]|nr:hypothetical protein QQP08_006391 [Theobroma cacao]WRX15457.1 hypothetical protein QQP08_007944 [Theobroma cacao]
MLDAFASDSIFLLLHHSTWLISWFCLVVFFVFLCVLWSICFTIWYLEIYYLLFFFLSNSYVSYELVLFFGCRDLKLNGIVLEARENESFFIQAVLL